MLQSWMIHAPKGHETGSRNLELLVELLNAEEAHAIAKVICAHGLHRRLGRNAQREIGPFLRLGQPWPHPCGVMGYRNRLGVLVYRAMGYPVVHGATAAVAPCRSFDKNFIVRYARWTNARNN